MVNAARFAKGMTFSQYVQYVGTPDNLKREGSQTPRRDRSEYLRKAYDTIRVSPAHESAWKWIVGQAEGPAKALAISPFFDVWRAAALDEWTAMLYERLRVGSLA